MRYNSSFCNLDELVQLARLLAHLSKRPGRVDKFDRRPKLLDRAFIQDQNFVVVHYGPTYINKKAIHQLKNINSPKAMGNAKDGRPFELLANGLLNLKICFMVYTCRGFIKDNNL